MGKIHSTMSVMEAGMAGGDIFATVELTLRGPAFPEKQIRELENLMADAAKDSDDYGHTKSTVKLHIPYDAVDVVNGERVVSANLRLHGFVRKKKAEKIVQSIVDLL